jgi:lysophospholipid acyltransferase (LPLAT)-like uncharacterized protein
MGLTDDPSKRKPISKRVRRWLAAAAVRFAAMVLPRLYVAYMWLVETTSRKEDALLGDLLLGSVERYDRAIAVLWHQEVFSVAYNYRRFHGHTLASVSDFGQVITKMLTLCNFTVFRGGSGSKSRRTSVLPALIDHMNSNPRVIYGLTVDGSRGPVYRVKPGCVAIARACRAPIVVVRTWYKRGITLPTWDRSQIPLPFNRKLTLAVGPYWIAPDADDRTEEAFRVHIENELLELAHRSFLRIGSRRRAESRWGFPWQWRSRWQPDQLGARFSSFDLDLENPPPWAHRVPASVPSHGGERPRGDIGSVALILAREAERFLDWS